MPVERVQPSYRTSAALAAERKPGLPEMVHALRGAGVELADAALQGPPQKLAALHDLDFLGQRTTFEHILAVAQADTLRDGTSAKALAADLFGLAGEARATNGRCYARANHTVYTRHHPAEFSRLVGELATRGSTTLASGATISWEPATLPVAAGQHADVLFSSLVHYLAKTKDVSQGGLVENGDTVYQGEMANLQTWLTGRRHINISGPHAVQHLNAIIDAHEPFLAEYNGGTAGALAAVGPDGYAFSMAEGGDYHDGQNLGYVIVPKDEADARGIPALDYPGSQTGYIHVSAPASAPTGANPESVYRLYAVESATLAGLLGLPSSGQAEIQYARSVGPAAAMRNLRERWEVFFARNANNPQIIADQYAAACLRLRGYGIDLGTPGRNHTDFAVHSNWARHVSPAEVKSEIFARLDLLASNPGLS
jgi:hypothetical protein